MSEEQRKSLNPPALSMREILGKNIKPLTDKQYLLVRDAGYSDIAYLDNEWFEKNKEFVMFENYKSKALPKQIKVIENLIEAKLLKDVSPLDGITYGQARKLIREFHKHKINYHGIKNDRYQRLILQYETNNAYKPRGKKNQEENISE